jgi:hypothetical protein
MAMGNAKVVSGSEMTTGLLKDFFRQLDDGSLTGDHLRAINEHRNPFLPARNDRKNVLPLQSGDEINVHRAWDKKHQWSVSCWRCGIGLSDADGTAGWTFDLHFISGDKANQFAIVVASLVANMNGFTIVPTDRDDNNGGYKFRVVQHQLPRQVDPPGTRSIGLDPL